MKKIYKMLWLLALLAVMPVANVVAQNVAKIGSTEYATLEAAFAAATDGDEIILLSDCSGNGIIAPQGKFGTKGLTVDFASHTYTVNGNLVGSTGTESQAFQLLKDNKITFKNGTIYSEKALFLVQNYSDLTLEGMTLTLNNPNYAYAYTLSNNNGNVVIDGTTINANPAGGFAFDVCRYSSYPSVSVTVQGNSTINGNVEVSASGNSASEGLKLTLTSGEINGAIVVDPSATAAMAAAPDNASITKAAEFKVNVAQIGTTKYETLEAAFAAATDGATITLLANCTGNGIVVPQGKFTNGLTVDFNGKTYTVDGETVGSTGTETNGFQLLMNNNITFKNGTIYSEKAKILVQNYSNLTLEGMTLTLNNPNYTSAYTLSNNNGNIVINSTTINANPAGGFAFDVCRYASYPSVNVEVKGNSVINGNVEISASSSDAKDGFGLTLTSGTMSGNIVVDASAAAAMKAAPEKATVTKADTFTKAAPEGYKWESNGEGTSKLVAVNYVAQIGTEKYETLEAAFAAAEDGATITLLADCAGNGIKVPQGKYTTGLTVNFGGFTYTVDGATVGSTGTETNGFQLLMNNNITFKDGTITSEKAKILVQNYSNLTLEGMTLTLNNTSYNGAYTLSNNNGNVVIDGTIITANPAGGFAFDVCRYASYPSVSVTVTGESVINGNVEISASKNDAKDGFGLTLTSGKLNGNIVVDATAKAAMESTPEKVTVTKANTFEQAAPAGYKWVADGENTSKLVVDEFILRDGTAYTKNADEQVSKATYIRSFGSDRVKKYQGWFVPFDYTITAEDLAKFRFFQINMIAHTPKEGVTEDANKLWIHLIKMAEGDVLKANRPYIFTPIEETTDYEFTTTNATLKAVTTGPVADCSTTTERFDFYGVYTSIQPTADNTDMFYYMAKSGEISRATKTTTKVGANRWIFRVTSKDGDKTSVDYSKSISFGFVVNGEEDDDDLTAVSDATAAAESEVVGYYTLNGQKVAQPTKGVYVVKYANGTSKKVVF